MENRAENATEGPEQRIRVYFRFDDAVVLSDYLGNAQALARLDSLAASQSSVTVSSYSSPEGNYAYNKALSERRANALAQYIRKLHPGLVVSTKPDAESWDALREAVSTDVRIPESARTQMLQIIDSDAAPDVKEAQLKKLSIYNVFYANHFRRLRYADVIFVTEAVDARSALLAGSKDAAKMQDWLSDTTVIYRLNSSRIDRDYMDNARSLDAILAMLEGVDAANVESILISAASSPEGPLKLNDALALRRGRALCDFITEARPDLADKITITSTPESWDVLRSAVSADTTLSRAQIDEILAVIDADMPEDARERKLKALESYSYLYKTYFPRIRYASVNVRFIPEAAPMEEDEPVNEEPAAPTETLEVEDTAIVIAPVPVPEPQFEILRTPLFAASTNVLYDLGFLADPLGFTPNFELELPLGQKWSVWADYTFPWWVAKANDHAWEMLKWDIGARRWLSRHDPSDRMDILSGHWLGVDLSAGYYDVEPKHDGYQGEFQLVGLEYGYAWKLSPAWRLNAFVGVGWMGTHYRYYIGDAKDEHLVYQHNGRFTWFGPTKAGVSIKYIFHKTQRREVR